MNLFLEICPYHAETLYPLISNNSQENDLALIHKNIMDWPLISAITIKKYNFSLTKFIAFMLRNNIEAVYANTVTPNMYPSNLAEVKAAIDMLIIPIIAKLFGAKIYAVLHEAEFYLPLSSESLPKRHTFFYQVFGKLLSKLYFKFYVLSPEVLDYLTTYSDKLELLSTEALSGLVVEKQSKDSLNRKLTWVGSLDSIRRNWEILVDLEPPHLEKHKLQIDLICDINSAQGPDFLIKLNENSDLSEIFITRNYRPNDIELLTAVEQGLLILCFYSNELYGKTKTSGARHIALAFNKLTIISYSNNYFVLLGPNGKSLATATSFEPCLDAAIMELSSQKQ